MLTTSVAYYNEARILDPATFDTITVLPNAPGAVDNCKIVPPVPTGNKFSLLIVDGGRTYPLEGVAMTFPQHAPYTDPMVVLLCGGSTPGPGIALDNCVSIEPEAEEPVWTIERMVSFLLAASITYSNYLL